MHVDSLTGSCILGGRDGKRVVAQPVLGWVGVGKISIRFEAYVILYSFVFSFFSLEFHLFQSFGNGHAVAIDLKRSSRRIEFQDLFLSREIISSASFPEIRTEPSITCLGTKILNTDLSLLHFTHRYSCVSSAKTIFSF